jgi:hypothetical protein
MPSRLEHRLSEQRERAHGEAREDDGDHDVRIRTRPSGAAARSAPACAEDTALSGTTCRKAAEIQPELRTPRQGFVALSPEWVKGAFITIVALTRGSLGSVWLVGNPGTVYMMADGCLLRVGSETWGPVSIDKFSKQVSTPWADWIPHRGRGVEAVERTGLKTWSGARSELLVPYTQLIALRPKSANISVPTKPVISAIACPSNAST